MNSKDTLAVIMMLDNSGSMGNALPMVKVDAKAFIRCLRPNDQFGINKFNTHAEWLYPTGTNPNILTVSADLKETKASVDKIEDLSITGYTNIGEALTLGNQMINQANTKLKAFVLLSDGAHNEGADPVTILKNEPPIYIAGLHILTTSYFDKLIAKNSNSRFYNAPNAKDMALMFFQILADSSNASLALKSQKNYSIGSDSFIENFDVSEDTETQLNIVWSDKKYRYTSGMLSTNNFNVILYNPDSKKTDIKPDIAEEGYCIFNMKNLQLGRWKVLIQYSVKENAVGTSAGMLFSTSISTTLDIPIIMNSGEKIAIATNVLFDNNPIEGLTVNARLSKPEFCIDTVMNKFETELKTVRVENEKDTDHSRLKIFRQEKLDKDGIDILPMKHTMDYLSINKDGAYTLDINDTAEKGVYNVEVKIEGIHPKTKVPFTVIKSASTMVG